MYRDRVLFSMSRTVPVSIRTFCSIPHPNLSLKRPLLHPRSLGARLKTKSCNETAEGTQACPPPAHHPIPISLRIEVRPVRHPTQPRQMGSMFNVHCQLARLSDLSQLVTDFASTRAAPIPIRLEHAPAKASLARFPSYCIFRSQSN